MLFILQKKNFSLLIVERIKEKIQKTRYNFICFSHVVQQSLCAALPGRSLGLRHIAQKTARRHISKTLSEIAPCMPRTSVTKMYQDIGNTF